MDAWRPVSTPGQALTLGAIHKPIADLGLTNQCVVLRGIDNVAAQEQGDYGNGHGISNFTVLTAGKAKNPGEQDDKAISYLPSIDQVIASRWGAPAGGFASINLKVEAHNYGSPFFKGPKQFASILSDPREAFTTLLSGVQTGTGAPDPAVVRAQALRLSVLDGTSKNLERYKSKLSAQDKLTVQAHFDAVRSIEQRVAAIQPPVAPSCTKPVVNGSYTDVGNTWQIMADIALAALRCGQTRVLAFEVGDYHMTWDPTPLPFEVGYDIGHSLHHMARDMGKTGPIYTAHHDWLTPYQQAMIRNRQLRAKMVATLLKGLQDTPEACGGNMLDNTVMLWASEFSNGASHLGSDMPVMLAGKAGGALTTGRYLNFNTKAAADDHTNQYASSTSMNNLLTSVLNLCGFSDTGFGDMQYATHSGGLVGL
jgi:Protein of unknown function (DUF1552)